MIALLSQALENGRENHCLTFCGEPLQQKEISPYSIVGLSATWDVTKNVSLTGGVDNLFDKRLWRAGAP